MVKLIKLGKNELVRDLKQWRYTLIEYVTGLNPFYKHMLQYVARFFAMRYFIKGAFT